MKFRRRNSSGAMSHRVRHAIQMPLQRENALRRAESAKRAVRRRIGGDGPAADAHVRAAVRPSRVDRPARKHHRRKRCVRAAVHREIDLHRQQFSVARHRRAMPRARGMPLRGGHHVFGAVVNNLHRLARLSTPAAPRAPRSSTDILPCRRIRRRSPSAPRECSRVGKPNSIISALCT